MGPQFGKLLIASGALLIIVGVILQFQTKLSWFGRLPGDISVHRGNFHFYAPIATSLLLSVLLSLLLMLFRR